MKWLITCLFLMSSSCLWASGIYNPGSSGSAGLPLPQGATNYIQNTLTPSTTWQSFAVQVGSFSSAGWYIMDSLSCIWQTQINTLGVLTTTKLSCPIVAAFVPCTPGTPVGVLAAITCPR